MKVKKQIKQEPMFEEIEVQLPSYGYTMIDGDAYCHDYHWKVEDLGDGKIRRTCIMLRQGGPVEVEEQEASSIKPPFHRDVDYFFGLGEYISKADAYAKAYAQLMTVVERAAP